jgi:hypothetical protein
MIRLPRLRRFPLKFRLCFGPAILLLLTGMAVEIGFTRPRVVEVQRLCARRTALSEQLSKLAAQEWASDRICLRLGCGHAEDSEATPANDLAELARKIDQAGLRRLEIVARESERDGSLLITRYTVRVTGDYRQNLEFVRLLEADARLVVIDAFRLEPAPGVGLLDAAYDLHLVDPIPTEEAAS